jgi:hypothetical protein
VQKKRFESFHVAVDTVFNSMRNRIEKNRPLLQSLAMFSANGFPEPVENFQNARDLEASTTSFCTTYRIYCAEELFTFALSFSKFNRFLFVFLKERKEAFHNVDGSDSEEEYYMMRMIIMIQIMKNHLFLSP